MVVHQETRCECLISNIPMGKDLLVFIPLAYDMKILQTLRQSIKELQKLTCVETRQRSNQPSIDIIVRGTAEADVAVGADPLSTEIIAIFFI